MYLIVGRVAPDFEPIEFGMAVKMVIRAVALATDKKPEVVERAYKSKGDMGILVKEMEFGVEGGGMNLIQVHENLLNMANDSGTGSQERKVESLKQLLVSMSPDERKYVVRIVLGKLRLGFSSKTIFDALSQMEEGNKSLRKALDERFQIFPDVGLLVEQIKESGMAGLSKIKIKSGVPVVPALCQRLNSYQEIVSKMKDVAVERKYDGTRVQIHFNRKSGEVRTYTRNLEETSKMFPELVQMGDWIEADDVILDSEAVGIDPVTQKVMPFQVTITRKRKHGIEETSKSVPLRFFVFDILAKNGESLIEKP
ncbi:MAG: putative DNA ligase, partial [Candidatus Collierbacteria bacterium GW2011_GWF2_44_15]